MTNNQTIGRRFGLLFADVSVGVVYAFTALFIGYLVRILG